PTRCTGRALEAFYGEGARLTKTEIFRNHAQVKSERYGRKGYLTAVDGLTFLRSLHSDIAQIVFLDPPFNLGKSYGSATKVESMKPDEYEQYLKEVIQESSRVLRGGGALFLYHLPYWASRVVGDLHGALTFWH